MSMQPIVRWFPIATLNPKRGEWVLLYAPIGDGRESEHVYVATWEETGYNSPPRWCYGPKLGEHRFRTGVFGVTLWRPLELP